MSTVIAGDIVLTTLSEALAIVQRKKGLAQNNLHSATLKVEALEKAIADYNEQLVLDIAGSTITKKK